MRKILSLLLFCVLTVVSSDAYTVPFGYSQVGYKQSAQTIPDAPVVMFVDWQPGDQSARIQAAIDAVARRKADKRTGLRGAILLGKGRFELSEPLRLSADGIVIRGAGRQATVLYKKGVDRGAVVYIEGKSGIVTGDSIPLSDVRAGDRVVVVRPSTKQWIHLLGCDNFGGGGDLDYWGWHPGEIDVQWTRTVTAVGTSENQNGGVLNAKNGGFIEFDVPLTMTTEQLGHVRLMRIKADGRLKNSGIENLTIDCATDSSNPKDENHAWDGVYVANATDCWVRMVDFRHLAGSAVVVQRSASQVTVEDCESTQPVSEIGGYRRRTFYCMGECCLFQRLYSEYGIHDFAVGLCAAGPNVFSQCDSYESLGFSGSLGPWCTGLLLDCVNIDGNDINLGFRGLEKYGSGWTSSNGTAYQCTASGIFADSVPDGSGNVVRGCWGQFNGTGSFSELNDHVKPWSLFWAQLATRTDSATAGKVCRVLERSLNSVSNNPTPAEARMMADIAKVPRVTMKSWIDSAKLSAQVTTPLPSFVLRGSRGTQESTAQKSNKDLAVQGENHNGSLNSTDQNGKTADNYAVVGGKLVMNGRLIVGGRQNTPWWNGRVRYSAFPKIADAVTRFVPGMEGQGTTTRIDSVAAHLKMHHIALFNQNYGLWYDRRRDDHERIRRRDGDVWAPFYEQTIARSGEGHAWDGLSKYDLSRLNQWYVYRVKSLAEATSSDGIVILNQHYFQHNILEAGAHWVDCPWRPVNNLNSTAFPEPVPFIGDKRVYMAEYFYDTANPTMARLHSHYIKNMLSAFAGEPNIIHSIGEEYTGPYHFTVFWLHTIADWEAQTGRHVLVALAANKDVQDSVMQDSVSAGAVDIINIEQWWYNKKGLYAPEGGKNIAPRQYLRRLRPGKVTFADVYRSVVECRSQWPDKAVVYYANAYDQFGWAVLMAGGSCPAIPVRDDAFLKAVATMNPAVSTDRSYVITNATGDCVIYVDADQVNIARGLSDGTFAVRKIDEKTGIVGRPTKITIKNGAADFNRGIYWLTKTK